MMMKRLKKLIYIFIVLAMVSQNFAAIISDNDGSAFVTKNEFEALKSDFQNQIEKYSLSIEGKIDGAIANYLAAIRIATKEAKEVAYFKNFESDTTTCTMRAYNELPFGYGNPKVNAGFNQGAVYTGNGRSKFYKSTLDASFAYGGNTNAKRRFVSKFKIGSVDKFRWVGYSTNYQEQFNITWIFNAGDRDTGFADGNYNVYCFGRSDLSDTASTKNTEGTTFWINNLKGRLGDTNQSHGVFSPNFCTVETTWNSYSLTSKKDLIYSDYPSSSQNANTFRAFQENNADNRWFAGSNSSYKDLEAAGTCTGQGVMNFGRVDSISNVSPNSTTYTNTNTAAYQDKRFFACGFEPDIKCWKNVYANDSTKYIDEKQESKTFQNYTMIDGMPLVEAEKNIRYEWNVKFSDTSDTYVWIKYGVFDGEPNENNCIKVKVDDEKTESEVAVIKNGEGTIKFKAETGGLIFAKWSQGKTMLVNESKEIISIKNSDED